MTAKPPQSMSMGLAGGVLALLVLGTASTRAEDSMFRETVRREAMSTEFVFTLLADPEEFDPEDVLGIIEMAFKEVRELEARVSRWIPHSQTSYINNRAAAGPVKVAGDIVDLLQYAKDVSAETGGAFDVTVGPLIELWGFYREEGKIPADPDLAGALAKVGMDKVVLDRPERTVAFTDEGVRLDFGGIGKGLALDVAVQVLRNYGITAAVLHAGTSTVAAIGNPPGEPGWTVRIRNPYNKEDRIEEILISDEFLSTSGSYEKFFELQGKEYCHIFDPRTGRPVEGMLSATAIAPSGMQSDALSTAFFVLGPEKTAAYCRAHPEVRAIVVPVADPDKLAPKRINFPTKKE